MMLMIADTNLVQGRCIAKSGDFFFYYRDFAASASSMTSMTSLA